MNRFFSFGKWFDRFLGPSSGPKAKRRARVSIRPRFEELEDRLPPAVTLAIANSNVIVPGPAGTANLDFTVTRSGDLASQLTVAYTTTPGSAQANIDFTPQTGTATFAYGSSTATIAIPVFGANAYKNPNLNFTVQLTGVVSVVGGPATMTAKTDFAVGSKPSAVAVADVNGDGKPDLIVTNAGDNTVSVLLNTTAPGATTPTFAAPQTFATGTNPVAVAVADLNGDGMPDLVVADDTSAGTVSVLLNTTAPGAALPSFAAHVDFNVGSNPVALAIRDLNGDGRPDLAVANSGSDSVSVLLNNTTPGAATPSFSGNVDFTTGTKPYAVAIGDLNGDGAPDIAVADSGSNSVSVLLNSTTPGATSPSFADKQDFTTGSKPDAVAIGDLNGDGLPDLAVANESDGTVSVLLNTTTPRSSTFSFAAKQDFQTGTAPRSVVLKDLNGDGKADLIIANGGPGANTVSVLENTTVPGATTPTFATQQTFATGAGPIAAAVGDLNGDAEPDLVVANNGSGANSVSVLLNTTVMVEATNTSAFPVTQFLATQSIKAVTGDINGDGKPDLVVATNHGRTATVLLNTTMPGATVPSFSAGTPFTIGYAAYAEALIDLNGDGRPDLVTLNQGDKTLSVLLNTTAPGSLVPSFAPQAVFGSFNNPRSIATADFNGDGMPDLVVADYSGFVSVLMNTTAPGAATPSFAPQQNFPVVSGPFGVSVGDFNGDGKPDIVVTLQNSNAVAVLLNTTPPGATTASFAAPQIFKVGSGPQSVAVGDLNGDGKADLAVANAGSNSASVLLNTSAPGATTLSFALSSVPAKNGAFRVGMQDLNGDGKPDLVLVIFSTNGVGALVVLNTTAPGASTPSFATAQPLTLTQPNGLAFADFNGDGRPDIVFPTQDSSSTSVVLNTPATIATGTATGTINETAQFSAAAESVNENAGTFSIPVTLSIASPVDTTIPFTVGGTAVSGTNYTGVTASPLIIPAGQTTATIAGTLLDDGKFDANKTLTFTIGTPTNAMSGSPAANTLTIQDSSTPPTISFASAAQTANENGGTFSVTVNLTGLTLAATTIPFTLSGTAVSGVNYSGLTASPLIIPAGQTSATITGTLLDDGQYDTVNKTLTLTLGTPTNATLGSTTADTITILESDSPPSVTFASTSQTVSENGGTFSATVKLSAASQVATTIPFTLGGTAVSSVNFSGITASPLVIAAGQTSATITGTLIDDHKYDTVNKTLQITLGTPTNATLGATAADTITIQESDAPPSAAFATTAELVLATTGAFSVAVNLSAASNAATSIPFALGGTAVGGADYSGVTASPLVIPAGQTAGSITGTILQNPGPNKTLTLTLGTPTNGTLGSTITNTLTIQEPDSFLVTAPNDASAGVPFIITVTALGAQHTIDTGYGGTVHFTSSDPKAVLPANTTLSAGFGYFLATLSSSGSQTITATDAGPNRIAGATNPITVSAGSASRLALTNVPANATTGSAFNVTVTALDAFGNIATGYAGHVHFTSSDAQATLPADATLSAGTGTFGITLKSGGSQTITATDTLATNPIIGGTSTPILTRGLAVSSLTPTATGFTASFSKPFMPADLTLYGAGLHTAQDVTLVGAHVGAISGSVIIDPSSTSMTFNATANSLSLLNNSAAAVLPDDTYTVTLLSGSGSNGFLDALGAGLDGTNTGGQANYTATFTTTYRGNKAPVLAIPDFARGPDGAHAVKVPNDTGHGIPITLYNAAGVTDVTFTLSYNPALLTVTGALGGAGSDASNASSSFSLVGTPTLLDAAHAQATFLFHDATARSGTLVLGDIQASVPDSAAASYKAKELLQLSNIVINNGGVSGAVGTNAVHVNAYFGDVTGNGTIDGLDVATANTVARGTATGFAAYQLLDPAIVGDVANDISVDAGDVSDLAALTVHLPTPVIPAIPTGLTIMPVGADPTLSLAGGLQGASGVVSIHVMLDHPHPQGSTGMTEAILGLIYDPSVLGVAASDITLGSIPGPGWQLDPTVDQKTGQIGIELYSTTAITANQTGSLVNIVFHLLPGANGEPTAVQLVNSVMASGRQFTTQVDDAQGQLVLSPGTDRLVVPAAGRMFQIGTLPALNTLLYRNSPAQRAADRLFLAMARDKDAAPAGAQDYPPDTSIWHGDAYPTLPPADRLAVVDMVFALMGW